MEIPRDSKAYPVAKKLIELIRKDKLQQRPQTPEEMLAEGERLAEEHKVVAEEMQARGDFKELEALLESCNSDEERASVLRDLSMAVGEEVMRRRNPEVHAVKKQLLDLLEQDGKLEESVLPEVLEAFRKMPKTV